MDDRLVDRGAGGGAVAEDVDDLGRRLDIGERRDDGGAVDGLAGMDRVDRDDDMSLLQQNAEHFVRGTRRVGRGPDPRDSARPGGPDSELGSLGDVYV